MSADVESSYRYCQVLARRSTSTFYWSFWLLPREKRRAMCALYAFSRLTDDLADCDEDTLTRQRALQDWRIALERALRGEIGDGLWPALRHAVDRYRIDPMCLHEVIDGVAMDLEPCRYESFEQLRRYCHRVASAVGLACLAIWGYRDDRAIDLARPCGVALQLTNILRDLREDAQRDRLYLPLEDLRRFGYRWEDLREGRINQAYCQLMQFQIARNEAFFEESRPILEYVSSDGWRACWLMLTCYRELLERIKQHPEECLRRRVRLAWHRKTQLMLRALTATRCAGPQCAPRAGSPTS